MVDVLVAFSHKILIEQDLEILAAFAIKNLTEQEPRLRPYVNEVNRIREAFEAMSYFNDVRGRRNSDEDVKKWVEDLIQIVHDLEVTTDRFLHPHLSHPQRSSIFKGFVACLCGQDPEQGDYLSGLPAIAGKVEDIRKRMPVDKLERRLINQYEMPSGDMPSLPPHDLKVQNEYADTLEKLMLEEQADRKKIFVYGKVGTGKSTVVSMACDRVKRSFKYFFWVTVSGLRDILDIHQNIWRAISKNSSYQVDQNSKRIFNFLNGNSYLLVLDGMDDISLVDDVMNEVPDRCGKIVITSRADLQNTNYVCTLEIKPLSRGDAEEFLYKKASPNLGAGRNKILARQSIMRFEGLLLGIAIVGSILSTKNDEQECYNVLEKLQHLPDSVEEKVKAFVSIGYTNLPPLLRACFLYTCSLFSENLEIPKGKLIRMWLAEGLVDHRGVPGFGTSPNTTVEEIAERQLNQLIQRNMLEIARLGDNGEVEACRVLAPMQSFVLDMFSGINFSASPGIDFQGCADCRNLSEVLMLGNKKYAEATTITKFNGKRFQSHHPFLLGQINQQADLPWGKFKLLDHVLGSLPHLGYLGLRGTGIKNLPPSLGTLQNLQTLDIRDTSVTNLPEECKPLPKLRHLFLEKSCKEKVVGIPLRFMSCSKELQTLSGLKNTSEGAQELKNLTKVRKLSVGNLMEQDSEMICTSINVMTFLRSLTLKCNQRQQLHIQSLEKLSCLKKLRLGGQFEGLLEWVRRLDSLVTLSLWDCSLTQDPLLALHHLPNLVRLTLNNAYAGECIHPIERGFFKLEYLTILRLRKLKNWGEINRGAMEMLQTLYIGHCPNLKMPPKGLENLCGGRLMVNIAEMPDEFQVFIGSQGYIVHFIKDGKHV